MHQSASPTFASTPLQHCPSRDPIPYPVSYPTTWYAFEKTPDFYACSNCFERRVVPAGLQDHFYPIVETMAGPDRYCNFNTPRVKSLVSQYRIKRKDPVILRKLEDHIAYRVLVKSCKFSSPVAPDDDFEWHRLAAGLHACHACYEDYLAPSTFARSAGDYDEFITAALRRIQVLPCAGPTEVPGASRKWYRPKYARARAHHLRGVLPRRRGRHPVSGNHIRAVPPAAGSPRLRIRRQPRLPVNFGLMMEFGETDIFTHAAEAVLTTPPCTPAGIHPGTHWYTLPGIQDFALCAACVATLVRPIQILDAHLVQGTGSPHQARPVPSTAPTPPRSVYQEDFRSRREGRAVRLPLHGRLPVHVTSLSGGSPSSQDHRWTGTGEFSACSDCARDVVFRSPLSIFMTYRDAAVAGPRKCDFYSPRVRLFWSQASRAPDPRLALSDFNSIMRHRDAVFRKLGAARKRASGPSTRGARSSRPDRITQLEALWKEVE
ncbi:unnamed protein product [Parascedosporium putredinis]|uniref:Uncharacterized protein n=1 Tax=Parascedosporium putredinis TaxID=1442378 RepID=A0A9P1H1H2_9PEZI|nr:unnamed protein product [Parascedosporium putredinis]CAI7995171.1 unnamed protein product [Parascedosporium putredinis]